jgi:uncharacterized protein
MILGKYIIKYKLDSNNILLINTLSGAIDIVDSSFFVTLEKKLKALTKKEINDNKEYQTLLERGYLYSNKEEEENEKNKIVKIIETTMKKNEYLTVAICPTLGCNFNCVYCYQKDIKTKSYFTLEQINLIMSTLIEELKIMRGKKKVKIDLFGGEPLLSPFYEQIKLILEKSASRGYEITIITNGYEVDKFLELILSYKEIISGIQITLDGLEEIHNRRRILPASPRGEKDNRGTFKKIVDNIDLLSKNKIPVTVRTNIDMENINRLPEYADFIINRWGDKRKQLTFGLAPVTDYKNLLPDDGNIQPESELVRKIFTLYDRYPNLKKFNLDLFRILSHIVNVFEFDSKREVLPRYYFCQATGMEYYILSPDNHIYCCLEAIDNEKYSVGKLFPDFYLDEEKLNRWHRRNIFELEQCSTCKYGPLCGGGCSLQFFEKGCKISCVESKKILFEYLNFRKKEIVNKFLNCAKSLNTKSQNYRPVGHACTCDACTGVAGTGGLPTNR